MKYLLPFLFVLWTMPLHAEEPRTIVWADLLPEGEIERLQQLWAQGEAELEAGILPDDQAIQFGTFNVVEELDGLLVRVPGYILPFQYEETGKISEFLLVPYFGACIHTPPPPPNQIVYVTAQEAADFGQVWTPIWAIGVLRTQKHLNGLGDAAYTLEFQSWEKYEG